MKYEVKKGGKVYMSTTYKSCQYPPKIEASIQAAGYNIYIDGKRQPRRTETNAKPKRSGKSHDKR